MNWMEHSISDVESNGSKAHFKMLIKWFINIDYSERNGVLWLSESEALTVRQQLSLLDFRMTWKELCEAWRRFDNLICFAELVPVHVFDFIFVAFNWTRKWTVAHGISNKYTNSNIPVEIGTENSFQFRLEQHELHSSHSKWMEMNRTIIS